MKRFYPLLLSLALGTVAFGLTRLDGALKAAPPVIEGASGDVLFASSFDEAGDEWETAEGRLSARIEGGILKIDVGSTSSGPFAPERWHFRDFDVTVVAAAVGGPVNNGYGVVFRLRDRRNYYSFQISSDGYYRLTRSVDGVERELSTWIASDAIAMDFGEANTIRVIGQGDAFRFFVNDTPVELCIPNDPNGTSTYFGGECIGGTMTDTLTDATHPTGRIGLIGIALGEPDVSVAFDNLVVHSP